LPEETVVSEMLEELGIPNNMVTDLEIDREFVNGIAYYEIDFTYDGNEYMIEVDAITGEIYTNSADDTGYDYYDDECDDDSYNENGYNWNGN
jgi:uncharacterized membrane protein YkoI